MDGADEKGIAEVDFLTDEILIQASRSRDLTKVRKLELQLDTEYTMIGDLGRRLPSLAQLRLNGSNIPCMRDLGTSLGNVTVLWMSRCNTASLAGISAMQHLEELYCAFNFIEDITPLGGLPELSTLDIEGNQVANIDDIQVLLPCTKLQSVTLEGNPAAREPGYRAHVAELLPNLILLDDEELGGDSDCGDAVSPLPADILAMAEGADAGGGVGFDDDNASPISASPASTLNASGTSFAHTPTRGAAAGRPPPAAAAASPAKETAGGDSKFATPQALTAATTPASNATYSYATPLSATGTAMSTRQLARAASLRRQQQQAAATLPTAATQDPEAWSQHWPQCTRGGRELQGLIEGMRSQILSKTKAETEGQTEGTLREREIDLTYESIKRSNTILAEDHRGASACGSRPVSASVRPSTAGRLTSLSGIRPGTAGQGAGGYSSISGIAGMFGGGKGGCYSGGAVGGGMAGTPGNGVVPHGSSALTFGTTSVFCGNPTRSLRTKKFEDDDDMPKHSSSTLAENLDKKGSEAVLESVIASKLAYQADVEPEDPLVTSLSFADCDALDLQDFTPVDSL